jgi:dsRNA-specific ribonuclease
VLDITPNDPDLMAEKASIYQAQGNLQEAAKLLKEVNAQTASTDAFEAILGAMYMDAGLESPRQLIDRLVGAQISDIGEPAGQFADFKTALQELLQSRSLGGCHYKLADETGPAHQKLFTIEVEVRGDIIGRGIGLTKRAAEQAAAKQAFEDLKRDGGRNVQEVNSTGVL